MLHSSSESEEQKGLLIDFDHAIFLPQRTSTLPMNVDGVLVNDTNQTEAENGEEGGSHQPTITAPEGAQSPLERTVSLSFSSWTAVKVLRSRGHHLLSPTLSCCALSRMPEITIWNLFSML